MVGVEGAFMSLKSRYEKWSSFQKDLFLLLAIAILGALVCAGFIFLDNIGVLLGWLLGSAVNIFSYVTIYKGTSFLLVPDSDFSGKKGYLSSVFAIGRILLYAGALLLAGFASFRWGSLEHGYCNLISTALALMPNWIVLLLVTFGRMKKMEPQAEEKQEEEP